jgi:hypothetical protein
MLDEYRTHLANHKYFMSLTYEAPYELTGLAGIRFKL